MITIKRFIFNPFQQNTYVLYDETKECAIIDPGCYSAEEKHELESFIADNNLKPILLLNTHCHVDHILGNAFVYNTYGLKPKAHRAEKEMLAMAEEQGRMFGFTLETPPALDDYLEEGNMVKLGNSSLKVLHVPGHSAGSLAFACQDQKFVITGDALFAGSIGRTDLPGGDYDQLMDSIRTKLLTLGDEFTVFAGHGPKTSIGNEALTNPFLLGQI